MTGPAELPAAPRGRRRGAECQHDFDHLRFIPQWQEMNDEDCDEFYCRRCLAKRRVPR